MVYDLAYGNFGAFSCYIIGGIRLFFACDYCVLAQAHLQMGDFYSEHIRVLGYLLDCGAHLVGLAARRNV